jgi:hypothetical protein
MLVQAVTLLISICEVSGSNVGCNIDYPDRHLSWLSSPPRKKYWDSTLKGAFASTSFQFITHYHPDILTVHNIIFFFNMRYAILGQDMHPSKLTTRTSDTHFPQKVQVHIVNDKQQLTRN